MIELSIRFTAESDDAPIRVSLFRPDSGVSTDPAPFTPPLGDDELGDLRWYLELFPVWPTDVDYDRAERIESHLEDWGRALRDGVIADPQAARLWQQFLDQTGDRLLTVDATDPRVLRLPWELLADEGGHVFVRRISVRRRLRQATTVDVRTFDLPVRVLLVVSRPEDAGFIDPRAVSLPLLDALDALGDRVGTEFLYPPTLAALSERLSDQDAPPVHVVHFDGHGVYDAALGLGYLLFEDDEHRSDRVDANRLGTLLYDCGVPLMALNACQSGKQEEANPYASVAARLIRAGVGSVLAMNYSVLVAAAHKFVGAFYGGLAGGLTVGRAVDAGRRTLLADEKRHTLTRRDAKGEPVEETVRLRDWFLPALYQQSADPVVFTPLPLREGLGEGQAGEGLPRALTDPTAPGGLPAPPLHGFHGRAREMLQLERALAERAVVVVHGFGGMGKTALAAEAGRWFHRTGRFPGGAAFVSFEHGGALEQLCSWVGQAVSGGPDWAIHGDGGEDPVARVAALLREKPALVILDNFESVLGKEPLMPPDELKAVLDAVWAWANVGQVGNLPPGGRIVNPSYSGSRVLITTRDTTFNDARFGPSQRCAHVPLGGLAHDDALALAAAVLDDHGIDRAAVDRETLSALMDHLGGHPLSLNLVLPHLRDHTPAELIARFEELLPGFTAGAAVERNESLAVSLEFSLRRLGQETRAALPDLAVFQGGAMEYDLLAVTQMDPELWQAARAELEAAALITAESVPGVSAPFLRFHPTLVPYLASLLPASRRAELEERYWHEYYATANELYHSDTQHPHQARAIAAREMPNLRRALDLAIEAGAAAEAVDFATFIAKFLDNFGRWREREAVMGQVAGLQVASEDGLTQAEYRLLVQQGDALLQQGRAADAERVFRGLLERIEAGAAYDAAYDHAMTLFSLGRCLAAQGRPAQAIPYHRRALEASERIGESSESARSMTGYVHADLADNLRAIGQFDQAQDHYETSLEIARQRDDHRSAGVALGQLGTLAMLRGDLAEAARRYTEALETFRALGEPQMEAVAWHQLGRVAQEAAQRGSGDWDEAERCYRESLRLKESYNDLPGVARTCNQLAIVAEGAGRPADAERWYLRAQEIKDQVSPHDASTLNNLAGLYLSQGRLDEAARYARRALEIKETLDLSAEPWTTYAILARIAEARGQAAEAAGWRRKEQESYAAYAGAAHQMQQLEPLIQMVVAACAGSAEARNQLEPLLGQLKKDPTMSPLAHAIRRILVGERDAETLAANLGRSGVLVRAILAQLAGEVSPTPAPSPASGGGEGRAAGGEGAVTLSDLLNLVAQACRPDAPPGLGEQLYGLTRAMSAEAGAPPEVAALGRALNGILSGERDPDLSSLPPDLAQAVRELLAALG